MSQMKPKDPAGKWIVAATVMSGTFLAVMDVSVVNVALPHMMGSFGQDLSSITWIATSYSIAEIIMVTMAGWWSTVIGRKRLYLASITLFMLGSVLCGTATTFPQMLVYRVLQGIGGGALIPVSQAILRESFPAEEQGTAMAVYGMGVVLAPATGPVIGGWLTDHLGWPWIFYINLPVAVIGFLMVSAYVTDPDYLKRGVRRIDGMGIALLALWLTSMQIVLERGQSENWFDSAFILVLTGVCVASLVALVVWELRVDDPVVNIRILKNVPLSVGSVLGVVFGVALFGTTFIIPQFTQHLLGYSALDAGLVLAPRAVMLLIFMAVAGRAYRHVSPRILVLTGVAIVCLSYWFLSRLSLDSGFGDMIPALLVMGAGLPFVFVTVSTVSLSTVPKADMTYATSIYTLARRVGGNMGYALAATLLDRGMQIHRTHLVARVTETSPAFDAFRESLASGAGALAGKGMVLLNYLVNRQAAMLAYNDISVTFGLLFLATVPLAFLFPGKKALQAAAARKK